MSWGFVQILASCHSRGVLHGDVKPENIMVSHFGALVTLIDFGSASLRDGMHLLYAMFFFPAVASPLCVQVTQSSENFRILPTFIVNMRSIIGYAGHDTLRCSSSGTYACIFACAFAHMFVHTYVCGCRWVGVYVSIVGVGGWVCMYVRAALMETQG
jgi:serine/threonine protein kinase